MGIYSYIGKGKNYIQVVGGTTGFLSMGNSSKLELSVDEEKKELPDYTTPGGGLDNSVSRIKAVKGSMTLHHLTPANLALVLRGASAAVAAGAVVDEAITARLGALVPFAYQPDPAIAPVVTNSAGTTTYVLNTDYTVEPGGIIPLSTGAITAGQALLVDYTKLAGDVVQALTSAGLEYQMFFDGLNEAASGKPVTARLHRVKFSPTSGLGLLGDDFAGLELTFDLLKDETITGTGLSKYAKIALAA